MNHLGFGKTLHLSDKLSHNTKLKVNDNKLPDNVIHIFKFPRDFKEPGLRMGEQGGMSQTGRVGEYLEQGQVASTSYVPNYSGSPLNTNIK